MEDEIRMFIKNHKWGGSGIESVLFEFILDKIKPGSTIIELGAGFCSTGAFSKFYNLYSIEDNASYINHFNNVNYILANQKNGWYDREIVKNNIPTDYAMVFVDGPSGEGNRSGLLNNLDIFKKDCIFIFHDTYRNAEILLAEEVSKKLDKNITFYDNGDYWAVVE
jgi:hypothetical protein